MHGQAFAAIAWRGEPRARTARAPVAAPPRAAAPPGPAGTAPAPLARAVVLVFMPFAAGYYLSYFFRSTNAVIAPQLTSEVGLDAGDLGLLTAMYFLTFAAFQLPLGVLLDRYGPRRVQAALLLAAAAGSAIFAIGTDIATLALGRGLIGLGVAGCLMASIKAGTMWFEDRHWPIVNGCLLAVGGLGAATATAPLEAALGALDWREIFLALGVATVGVSLLIFSAVPERPAAGAPPALGRQIRELGRIYADAGFWRIAPLTVTGMAANLGIQGLWAGPWLRDVAGFDRDGVATYLLALALALTAGSVLLGVAASWVERRGVPLLAFFGGCAAVFLAFQAAIVFELAPAALWPWIGFGLLSNYAMVTFSWLARHFTPELAGRAITAMNVFIFAGIFVAQYLIGEVIDLWPAAPGGGYAKEAYAVAFGAVALLQVASFAWFLAPWRRRQARPSG